MSSTYSPSLNIQLIANGDQSGIWGTTTNTNWGLVEQAIAGVVGITMVNANYTMSDLLGVSDEARNMVVIVSGSNSAIYQVVAPLKTKLYLVVNNTSGGYAITFGGVTGATVTIPNGYSAFVFGNGIGFYAAGTSCLGGFDITGNANIVGSAAVGAGLAVTGNTSVTGNLTLTGTFNYTPVGMITPYPSNTPPAGFLLCNGAAVSRGTYANLFALVGTTFGAGDGSTTFNLPNLSTLATHVYYVIKT